MLHLLKPDADAARVRVPPPLIFLTSIVCGYLLDTYVVSAPLSLGPALSLSLVVITLAPSVLVLTLALLGHLRSGQNPEPWKTTPSILTTGVYRWTRNPMYLGMALGQLAIGFWFDSGWIIGFTAMSMACVHHFAIKLEEAYLLDKFGDEFASYMRQVRRWI